MSRKHQPHREHPWLVGRLGARDDGDVVPPPYRELVRPPLAIRNATDVADYSRALAERVSRAGRSGEFVLVLGGDCSIVLGSLLGVTGRGRTGLVYTDAHSDFVTADVSSTGSAAAMCLAPTPRWIPTPKAPCGWWVCWSESSARPREARPVPRLAG